MNRIKAFLAALAAGALIVMQALLGRERARRELAEQRAQSAEAAREYERTGAEAMISGLEKEQEVKDEAVDTARRDHFE